VLLVNDQSLKLVHSAKLLKIKGESIGVTLLFATKECHLIGGKLEGVESHKNIPLKASEYLLTTMKLLSDFSFQIE
jgi:hypothetical protein